MATLVKDLEGKKKKDMIDKINKNLFTWKLDCSYNLFLNPAIYVFLENKKTNETIRYTVSFNQTTEIEKEFKNIVNNSMHEFKNWIISNYSEEIYNKFEKKRKNILYTTSKPSIIAVKEFVFCFDDHYEVYDRTSKEIEKYEYDDNFEEYYFTPNCRIFDGEEVIEAAKFNLTLNTLPDEISSKWYTYVENKFLSNQKLKDYVLNGEITLR